MLHNICQAVSRQEKWVWLFARVILRVKDVGEVSVNSTIQIKMDLGSGKKTKQIAGLGSALLKGFDRLAKHIYSGATAMMMPDSTVDRLTGGVLELVVSVNEFNAAEVSPGKIPFDSNAAHGFMLKLLKCFIENKTATLEQMEINPDNYDPKLGPIGDELLEALRDFLLGIQKFVGLVPVSLSTSDDYVMIPSRADKFWNDIRVPKETLTADEMDLLADDAEVVLRIVDGGNLNCWKGKVNNDKILPLKFVGRDCNLRIFAISGSLLKVRGLYWDGAFLIIEVHEVHYPKGVTVDPPLDEQMPIDF